MRLCVYGCGQEAKYHLKNGKMCCNEFASQCKMNRKKISEALKGRNVTDETKKKIGNANRGRKHSDEFGDKIRKLKTGLTHSKETRKKISESNKGKRQTDETKKKIGNANRGRKHSDEAKQKMSIAKKGFKKPKEIIFRLRLSIKQIKERYPLFSKIEEVRYNPDKPKEKEIQVHCKNNTCPNSKEQSGWFTPSKSSISDRITCIERFGLDHSYFYCSEECKNECSLYRVRNDPLRNKKNLYTDNEYKQFREFVLNRDNYKCQYCEEKAEYVHHERPQKLEPFFSLDPDLAWSVCKGCHYEKGHQEECSTGQLAKRSC